MSAWLSWYGGTLLSLTDCQWSSSGDPPKGKGRRPKKMLFLVCFLTKRKSGWGFAGRLVWFLCLLCVWFGCGLLPCIWPQCHVHILFAYSLLFSLGPSLERHRPSWKKKKKKKGQIFVGFVVCVVFGCCLICIVGTSCCDCMWRVCNFFLPAPVTFRRVTTPVDQRGIQLPPAVCLRRQEGLIRSLFFSVQRLHGFRQVVQQVCTCRKLIGKLTCMSVKVDGPQIYSKDFFWIF